MRGEELRPGAAAPPGGGSPIPSGGAARANVAPPFLYLERGGRGHRIVLGTDGAATRLHPTDARALAADLLLHADLVERPGSIPAGPASAPARLAWWAGLLLWLRRGRG